MADYSFISALVAFFCLLALCQTAPVNFTLPCEPSEEDSMMSAADASVSNQVLKLALQELLPGAETLDGEVRNVNTHRHARTHTTTVL